MTWGWCRVYADRVEITAEADGTRAVPVKHDVRYGDGVKDSAALTALIAKADAVVPVKVGRTTDSGGVRAGRRLISRSPAPNRRRSCSRSPETRKPSKPDRRGEGPDGVPRPQLRRRQGSRDFLPRLSFAELYGSRPRMGARASRLSSPPKRFVGSRARAATSRAARRRRRARFLLHLGKDGEVLAKKVFDPLGGAGVSVDGGQSLRVVCRANS